MSRTEMTDAATCRRHARPPQSSTRRQPRPDRHDPSAGLELAPIHRACVLQCAIAAQPANDRAHEVTELLVLGSLSPRPGPAPATSARHAGARYGRGPPVAAVPLLTREALASSARHARASRARGRGACGGHTDDPYCRRPSSVRELVDAASSAGDQSRSPSCTSPATSAGSHTRGMPSGRLAGGAAPSIRPRERAGARAGAHSRRGRIAGRPLGPTGSRPGAAREVERVPHSFTRCARSTTRGEAPRRAGAGPGASPSAAKRTDPRAHEV